MQQAPYVIKEAAIFFETGSNKDMDVMVGVSAPLSLRTNRAMQRTSLSETEVKARIAKQMDQEEKMKLCDYVIINDEATAIIPRVIELHELFLQKK
jgi:dephospho-CoA kinase